MKALGTLEAPELARAVEVASKDPDESVRKAAIELASKAGGGSQVERLERVLEQGTTQEKQAAFATLAKIDDPRVDDLFVRWLHQFSQGKIASELQLDLLEAAGKRTAPLVKEQVAKSTPNSAGAKENDIGPWRSCLNGGNVEEGRKIFTERAEVSCVRCHKVDGEGGEVGPEMTGVGQRRDREYILQSILFPNAQIAEGFETVLVTLKNGMSYAGILKSETADEIELNSPEDGLLKIKKSDVTGREKGLSGMPIGVADILTRDELRNLVEFLASLK